MHDSVLNISPKIFSYSPEKTPRIKVNKAAFTSKSVKKDCPSPQNLILFDIFSGLLEWRSGNYTKFYDKMINVLAEIEHALSPIKITSPIINPSVIKIFNKFLSPIKDNHMLNHISSTQINLFEGIFSNENLKLFLNTSKHTMTMVIILILIMISLTEKVGSEKFTQLERILSSHLCENIQCRICTNKITIFLLDKLNCQEDSENNLHEDENNEFISDLVSPRNSDLGLEISISNTRSKSVMSSVPPFSTKNPDTCNFKLNDFKHTLNSNSPEKVPFLRLSSITPASRVMKPQKNHKENIPNSTCVSPNKKCQGVKTLKPNNNFIKKNTITSKATNTVALKTDRTQIVKSPEVTVKNGNTKTSSAESKFNNSTLVKKPITTSNYNHQKIKKGITVNIKTSNTSNSNSNSNSSLTNSINTPRLAHLMDNLHDDIFKLDNYLKNYGDQLKIIKEELSSFKG